MFLKHLRLCIVTAMPIVWLGGCTDQTEGTSVTSAPDSSSSGGVRLPSMVDGENHGAEPSSPDLCVWATSVDAIVLGELAGMRLMDTPAFEYVNDYDLDDWRDRWQRRDDCPTSIFPAMELDVDVEHTLRGEVGSQVTARLGYSHRRHLDPLPSRGEDDTISWGHGGDREGVTGPLERGQSIGLALHYVPEYEALSLMYEPLFAVDSDGRVVFQYRRGFEPGPDGAEGLSAEELIAALAACAESNESAERRAYVRQKWGPDGSPPIAYIGAMCFGEDQGGQDECTRHEDCGEDQFCVHAECQDADG